MKEIASGLDDLVKYGTVESASTVQPQEEKPQDVKPQETKPEPQKKKAKPKKEQAKPAEPEEAKPLLQEKLCNIQCEMRVGKTLYNDFGDFYYRSAEQILETAKPLCHKYGCVVILHDKILNIGNRFYIEAHADLYDTQTEQMISCVAYAREPDELKKMSESQITGSASSYARKYALNGLFALDDAKDPDALSPNGKSAEGTKSPEVKQVGQPQPTQESKPQAKPTVKTTPVIPDPEVTERIRKNLLSNIREMLQRNGKSESELSNWLSRVYNVKTIDELTQDGLNQLFTLLSKQFEANEYGGGDVR